MKKRGGGSGSGSSTTKRCGQKHTAAHFKKIARHTVLKEVNDLTKGDEDLQEKYNKYIEHLDTLKDKRKELKNGLTIVKEGTNMRVFCRFDYGAKGLTTDLSYSNVFIAQSEKSRENK
jgi:hypothetical protein